MALDEIRRIVDDLRPPALDELGLLGAIRQHAQRLPQLEMTVSGGVDASRLPAAVEVAAYRIATEALTNVARHSDAARASVDVTPTPMLAAVGAVCHLLGGDVERAEATLASVAVLAADDELSVPLPLTMALRALLCACRGDHDGARHHQGVAEAEFSACGPLLFRGDVAAWALAEVATLADQPDHGVEMLRTTWQRLNGRILPVLEQSFVGRDSP